MTVSRLVLRGAQARSSLAFLALVLLLPVIFYLQPRVMSYGGLSLLFGLVFPVVLATLAQTVVMAAGDLDLSIGAFVSFVACVVTTFGTVSMALTSVILAAGVLIYVAMAALISWRQLPSLVMTLGLSFVWFGLAVIVRPEPGGTAPDWLLEALDVRTPGLPVQIVASCIAALGCDLLLNHTRQGLLVRAAGGSPVAFGRSGHSLARARMLAYGLAGLLGIGAGAALVGVTTSADPDIATRYTLVSIAAVVLGGGEFSGGRVSVAGAAAGAFVMVLTEALLSFIHVAADWQIGAQGLVLLLVLALRRLLGRMHVAV